MRRQNLKSIKYILTVLLVILIVLSAVAADGVTIVNRTALNPSFYSKTLQRTSAYDGVYHQIMGSIQSMSDQIEGLPDAFKGEMTKILEQSMPKEKFTALFATMIGESVNWMFYNGPEVHMPFSDIVADIQEGIKTHPTVVQTEGLYDALKKTVVNCFKGYLIPADSGDTLRDYVHYYMGGGGYSEDLNQRLDFVFDAVIYAYVGLVTKALYIAWAVFALCVVLLFVLWRRDIKKPMGLMGYTTAVVGLMNALVGGGMLIVKDRVMARFESINAMLPPFVKGLESGILLHVAIGILVSGVIILAVGVALIIAKRHMGRKVVEPRLVEQSNTEAA